MPDGFLHPFLNDKHSKILRGNPAMQRCLEIYVPLQFSLLPPRPGEMVSSSQGSPLEHLMLALLTGTLDDIYACFPETSRPNMSTRVFFLQGYAGAGKSLFCWYAMKYFDIEIKTLSSATPYCRVPIVISLPIVKSRVSESPFDFLVLGILDAYPALKSCFEALDRKHRQDLFTNIPFLFFLDAVDELFDENVINCVNRLYNPTEWRNSIFVITCRSEVLKSSVVSSSLPPREFLPDGPVQPTLMKSFYLLPFSAAQRNTFVKIFAKTYADLNYGWTAKQYIQALKAFPEIEGFLQEPLQLFLVLSVLPVLVAGKVAVPQADLCEKHQCVKHNVHILYQDSDLTAAQKLASDIEQHPDARRRGLTVFLKDACISPPGCNGFLDAARCSRHLSVAQVIVPIVSSSTDSSTLEYLENIVSAMNHHGTSKAKVCPLFLASSKVQEAEAALLSTPNISFEAKKCVSLLNTLNGLVLTPKENDYSPFVNDVVKMFEARKFFLQTISFLFILFCLRMLYSFKY